MKNLFILIIALYFISPIVAQVERKVIVEHFTNSKCSSCASRNPAFYSTLANYPDVLHIAYHPSAPYVTCIFSQHNPIENDLRTKNYGIFGGTPRAVLQGEVIPIQSTLISAEQIEAALGGTSDYSVVISTVETSMNNFKVTIEIKRESGLTTETLKVFAGLAEKEVHYNAPNGEDLHHDVFRKTIFDNTTNIDEIGQVKTIEYEYATDAEWEEDQMFAYVIIQNNQTNAVMQAGSSYEAPSGITIKKPQEISSIFYPNPTSGLIRIKDEYQNNFVSIEVYDLVGTQLKQFNNSNELNISDLPEGFYLVRLTDLNRLQYTTRIIKSNR